MAQILGFFSVSPAPAGMIPFVLKKESIMKREPRTRGDDPIGGLIAVLFCR